MTQITYDWPGDDPPPGPGDALVCVRRRNRRPTGTAYLILAAHEVLRVEPVEDERRMRYVVARIGLPDAVKTPRWEALVWNHR